MVLNARLVDFSSASKKLLISYVAMGALASTLISALTYLSIDMALAQTAAKTMSTPAANDQSASRHFKEAQKFAKRGEYDKAIKALGKKFDFSSRSTPVAISATVCSWNNRIYNHDKAAVAAELGIKAHMPWWFSEYLKTKKDETVDVSGYTSKIRKNHLILLGCYGEAQSMVYSEKYSKLSAKDRAQMRHEIKKTYDFLIQSDYPAEKSEEFNARVAEADDRAVKSRRKFFFDGKAHYMFWQEVFSYHGAGKGNGNANVQVFCPGFQMGYRSFFTEYGIGACLGYGKAKMDFDGLAFKDNRQAIILDINAAAIKKVADNRMGFGAEFNAYMSDIDSASDSGYKAKKSSEFRTGLLLVTRLNYDNFSFDIKGGRYLDLPSAMFTLGFTFNLKEK